LKLRGRNTEAAEELDDARQVLKLPPARDGERDAHADSDDERRQKGQLFQLLQQRLPEHGELSEHVILNTL